jgi:hypothetical protein
MGHVLLSVAIVALAQTALLGCAHAPRGWAPTSLDAVRGRRPEVVRVTGTERSRGAVAPSTHELRLVMLDELQLVGVELGGTRAVRFAVDEIERIELRLGGDERTGGRYVRDETGLHVAIVVGLLVAGVIAGAIAVMVDVGDGAGLTSLGSPGGLRWGP